MAELTAEQLAQFRELLQARRTQLVSDIRQQMLDTGDKHHADIAGRVHDAGDESIAEVIMGLNSSIAEQETIALKQVEAALERIRTGRYGDCVDCGESIEPARLQAAPEASRCVPCQEKREGLRGAKDTTPTL